MTDYAIMRCEKVKSMGQLARTLKHNFREQETPNADPERTAQNEHDGSSTTDQTMGAVRGRLPDKRRKDAVIAIEYMMTASPEWMKQATPEQQKQFFENSKQWLIEKYGKENVVLSSIHRDETTPHMAAWVTPITKDGRLCAKDFIGGPAKLRADQTDYHQSVKDLGLSRGIEGSTAKHERIQTFYSRIQPESGQEHEKRFKSPQISSQDIKPRKVGLMKKEEPEQVAQRINQHLAERWADAGLTTVIRGHEVGQAKATAERSRQSASRSGKEAKAWQGFMKRLKTMDEQGIKAPDGGKFSDYVKTEIKKSQDIESKQKTKTKSHSKGIDR